MNQNITFSNLGILEKLFNTLSAIYINKADDSYKDELEKEIKSLNNFIFKFLRNVAISDEPVITREEIMEPANVELLESVQCLQKDLDQLRSDIIENIKKLEKQLFTLNPIEDILSENKLGFDDFPDMKLLEYNIKQIKKNNGPHVLEETFNKIKRTKKTYEVVNSLITIKILSEVVDDNFLLS